MRAAAAKLPALLGQPQARVEISVGAGSGHEDERTRRFREAERHPIVQDLIRHFEADISARDLGNVQDWLARFSGPAAADGDPDA